MTTTANFILPFNDETRQTILPASPDEGKPYQISFVHLACESGGKVLAQVRADDAVIEAMKADTQFTWLGDVASPAKGTSVGVGKLTSTLAKYNWTLDQCKKGGLG